MRLSNLCLNTQAILFLRFFEERYSLESLDAPPGARWLACPYFNGRERGFVLSVRPGTVRPNEGTTTRWAFFEHRSCDGLCAVRWEDDGPLFEDYLTVDDISPERLSSYRSSGDVDADWACGDFGSAAEWLAEQLFDLFERATEEVAL